MPRRPRCPQCDSPDLEPSEVGGTNDMHVLRIGRAGGAVLEHLTCASCGFVETFVPSAEDRRRLGRAYGLCPSPRDPFRGPFEGGPRREPSS